MGGASALELFRQAFRSHLGRDVLLTLLSQVVVMLVAFAINKLVSVGLGVEGYAAFSVAKKSATVVGYGVLGGMAIALPRYLAIYMAARRGYLSRLVFPAALLLVLVNAFLFTASLAIAPGWFSELFLGSFASKALLFTMSVYAMGLAISTLTTYYYRGVGDYRRFNYLQIAAQVLLLVVVVVYLHTVEGLFLLWGCGLLLLSVVVILFDIRPGVSFTGRARRLLHHTLLQLASYGTPRLLADLVLFASDAVPLLLVLRYYGRTATGYFSAALTILVLVTPLFSFTGSIFLQRISSYYAQGDYPTIGRVMRYSLWLFLAVAVVGTLGLLLLAQFLIPLLFSSDFMPAVEVARVLALAIIPKALYYLYRNPCDAIARFPYNLVSLSLYLLVLVVSFALTDTLMGCAYAYVLASVVLGVGAGVGWGLAFHIARRG